MESHVLVLVLGLLLAISELLALIPSVKSNSVFTLVVNLIKSIKGSQPQLPEPPKEEG